MSFHQERGAARPGMAPGPHVPAQTYRPTNLRPPPPQPPVPPYHYDPQLPPSSSYHSNSGYMHPHANFMQYPPPAPSQTPGALNQCPVRPPFPKPPGRQGFPDPPPHFPPPPLPSSAGGPPPPQVSAQNTYQPYMMPPPPITHPPMPPPIHSPSMSYHPPYPMNSPHPPHPPFPPPTFNPGHAQSPGSFAPDHSFRHGGPYKHDRPADKRRSPERGYRHDDHRQKSYSHSDKHKMEFFGDRKDRGRSPDRRWRPEGGRHRSEYDRGRTPPRHRSRERSR